MRRGLADTSVFVAKESGRPLDVTALPDEIAISVITIGELRAGVLAASDTIIRDLRLLTLSEALAFEPVPVDARAAESWATLRVTLASKGRSMPVNDSWIAATALSLGVPVVTQDDDYAGIPGLEVIMV